MAQMSVNANPLVLFDCEQSSVISVWVWTVSIYSRISVFSVLCHLCAAKEAQCSYCHCCHTTHGTRKTVLYTYSHSVHEYYSKETNVETCKVFEYLSEVNGMVTVWSFQCQVFFFPPESLTQLAIQPRNHISPRLFMTSKSFLHHS